MCVWSWRRCYKKHVIRGLFIKFVDKSYNVIKSTTILIKCISFKIYTPIQSKSHNNVSTFKRFWQRFMFTDTWYSQYGALWILNITLNKNAHFKRNLTKHWPQIMSTCWMHILWQHSRIYQKYWRNYSTIECLTTLSTHLGSVDTQQKRWIRR